MLQGKINEGFVLANLTTLSLNKMLFKGWESLACVDIFSKAPTLNPPLSLLIKEFSPWKMLSNGTSHKSELNAE
jgi:hypothetical protein